MRILSSVLLALILSIASGTASADVVKKTTALVQENPGKSSGVAACAAIVIFPPAAIWCAATIAAGATYDGDTQKIVKAITK